MKRILCTVCLSLLGWQALAGEVDDKLKNLEAALPKSAKAGEKTPTSSEAQQWPEYNGRIIGGLSRLREQLASNRLSNAIGTLDGFHQWPLSEDARKAVDELLGTLRKDLDARIKTARAPYNELLNRATDAVKKAKAPADLDTVLQKLDAFKNLPEIHVSDAILSQRGGVESAYAFVAKWQEYLAAKAGGYDDEARAIAKNLAASATMLLPRSEILAKAFERKPSAAPALPTSQPSPAQ